MKAAVVVGMLSGATYSLFTLYAMLAPVPYSTWDYTNSALYLTFLIALLGLAVGLIQYKQMFSQLIGAVAVASLLFTSFSLLTYWISTAFFADRLYQLPFFAKDYAYHGYTSPQQYLFTGNNYVELMQLQAFSCVLTFLFRVALAGAVAWVWQQIRNRPESVRKESN